MERDTTSKPAITSIAALCFLGAGYTHKAGRYRSVVDKAVSFVVASQNDKGFFGGRDNGYSDGFCTLALAEAYGMTKDVKLSKPLELAVNHLIEEHQSDMGGWRYSPKVSADSSVTAAITMALKDAKLSGIKGNYDKAFDGVKKWFDSVAGGKSKGIGGYTATGAHQPSCTAILMFCNQLMGMKRDSPAMKESAEYILSVGPTWTLDRAVDWQHDYYVYYATLGMFQYGGKEWKQWNEQMKKNILSCQISGGCGDGSWVTANGKEKPGYRETVDYRGGKVLTTSFAILTLEVYYRYSPLFR